MTMTPTREAFDYIIVGAGSAGCVLANRLTADPSVRVLLLEAGGRDNYVWIHVPIGLAYIHNNPRFDWCFESEPEPYLDKRRIRMPRGKTLGGSSSINGMVYVRGHASDYDQWRQLGNAGWAWDDVLPYFKKSEDHYRGASDTHGAGGELKITVPGQRWEILDAYADAAAEQGLPKLADYNGGGGREGTSIFELTVANGVRWSAAKGFLKPVRGRANLKIVTGANVSRLLLNGRTATGVAYTENGAPREATANAEVILSAGAFGSPQILQVSGIGPGVLLREQGIGVVHDLPGVGENLQDHWMLRVLHRVSNTATFNQAVDTYWRKALAGLRYVTTRDGPLAAPVSLMTAFAKSRPDVVAPDIQLQISIASYEKVGGPLHPFPGIGSSICICRPTSRGHLRIKSADAAVPPAIVNNFLGTEEDRRIPMEGLKLVRRIAASKAFARFAPDEIQPTAKVQSEDEVLAFARANASTVFHPVGTCMMGRSEMSVVDERLRVRGVEKLRVVDASIMPTITSGNTNAPTFMIAEKGADMIRADRR